MTRVYARRVIWTCVVGAALWCASCAVVKAPYDVTKTAVKTGYLVTKGAVKATWGTCTLAYRVGEFAFEVVKAPLTWPFMRDGLESIDGLPPKEAVRQGRVKMAPYVVRGKRYVPMSVDSARSYRQKGIASWYGYETRRQEGGHMTANGEAFNPEGLSAAHKRLPLPSHVRVTNLDNNRSIIVRVNDRGPFVPGRIIDLSSGAARKLGFFRNGTARVLVETVSVG